MKQQINELGAKLHAAYDKAVRDSLEHNKAREYLQADADADYSKRLKVAWKSLEVAYNALLEGE